MKCPECGGDTKVTDTRYGDTRTRRCFVCGCRFQTFETLIKTLTPGNKAKATAPTQPKG